MHPYARERARLIRVLIGNAVLVAGFPVVAWVFSGWTDRIVALLVAVVGWAALSFVSFASYRRTIGNPVRFDRHLKGPNVSSGRD